MSKKGNHVRRFLARMSMSLVCAGMIGGCSSSYYLESDGRMYRLEGREMRTDLDLLLPPDLPENVAIEPPAYDLDHLALEVHKRVNEIRKQKGLAPLGWSGTLKELAQDHSQDMACKGYFSHENLDGEDATRRAVNRSVDVVTVVDDKIVEGIGENLFLTQLYSAYTQYTRADGNNRYVFEWKTTEDLAVQTVEAWLESPGHRKNLLSTLYASEAIGVALGPNETLFVTQNLSGNPETRVADASY